MFVFLTAPEPPRSVRPLEVGETFINFTWDPPLVTNGLIVEYQIRVTPEEERYPPPLPCPGMTSKGSGEDVDEAASRRL